MTHGETDQCDFKGRCRTNVEFPKSERRESTQNWHWVSTLSMYTTLLLELMLKFILRRVNAVSGWKFNRTKLPSTKVESWDNEHLFPFVTNAVEQLKNDKKEPSQ